MTYIKNNLTKPGTNKGVGGNKKDKITFFDFDDVLTFPSRDDGGIVITGNIVMKPNAYMITVYGSVDTIKNNSESGGETDAKGITQSVIFNHPGNDVEVREFRTNWLSRSIGIIVEHCADTKVDQYGSPCAPLLMDFKHDEDKDKNVTEFTIKSALKGPDVADYRGTMTYSMVTGTITADAITADVSNGTGRYLLTDGTDSSSIITTCENAVVGGKYTFVGSGGSNPSMIAKENDFLLANGTTWTALAGSEITFQAFKSDTASWKFLELSRR